MIEQQNRSNATGPKIRLNRELPEGLIPVGEYKVLCERAEFRISVNLHRPYIVIFCSCIKSPYKGHKVYYCYSRHMGDILPRNEEECKTFVPIIATAHVRHRQRNGITYPEVRRLDF